MTALVPWHLMFWFGNMEAEVGITLTPPSRFWLLNVLLEHLRTFMRTEEARDAFFTCHEAAGVLSS